jgi:DNA replication and repair protein RecF
MILKNISIINYKNIASADLSLSPKINCFIGSNGEGKTNLLDAVYYLSFCRSASNPIDSQVIRHGQEFFVLQGKYLDDYEGEENVYCGMKRGTKKRFKRNEKDYKRLSEHIGLIPLVMISPSDNILIDGGSEERRRLMDVVISQYDHEYIDALTKYSKALAQRNALLKMEDEPDIELLKLWEEQMAAEGTKIYYKRDNFVRRLIPVFQSFYNKISEDNESVSLNYISHGQRGDLLGVIQRDRFKDRIIGYSLHGIHRDDLEMTIGGYPLKREGSQGQNKTFVIALKLAQFDFLHRAGNKVVPILLLDDIFDKLDANRVEQIVKIVAEDNFGQIFITDTNRDHLDRILRNSILKYKIFSVVGGTINEKDE